VTIARICALALVVTMSGCVTTDRTRLLPMTDANLKAVGKRCRINGIALAGEKLIYHSGMFKVRRGESVDKYFQRQVACLRKHIDLPDGTAFLS
jgi:hypothetical protein